MVPSGWRQCKIGEIAEIQVGRDLREESYSTEKTETHFYPVYSNTVDNRGLYGYYDFAEYPGNSVTVVGRGIGIGTAFARFESEAFGAIGRLLVLSPKNNSFDVGYLADHINFLLRIHNENGGIPQLPGAAIASYLVTIPSFPEQKKIAKILSVWDKAITTTEQLLANSQQQKKALMQKLLTGKVRLLDENGVRFDGEWKECLVSDYFDVGSSKRVLQEDWKTEGAPFYRTRELVSLSKNEPFRSEIFISDELFLELSEKYGVPKSGDFLVSGVGTLGISYQVKEGDRFYFKDGNVLWFKIKNGIDSDYFKYCFQSDFMQDQITAQASITTVGTYTIQNAKKTKFWCPEKLEEQQKIASVLSAAERELLVLKRKLDALKQEKKALMQTLLTGKRRVRC